MRVALYPTCAVDVLAPGVGLAAVRLLERLGVDVRVPSVPSCCGQPAFNAGQWPQARSVARGFVSVAERLLSEGADFVVIASGSCAAMTQHGYEALFGDERDLIERARGVTARVRELSQFLTGELGVEDVGARCAATATYHPSCHGQRILGITDEPLRLLRKVRGLTLVDLPYAEDCCGFGGTFSVKLPDVSGAMVAEKAQHVEETDADLLITNDMACGMNIEGRLRRQGSRIRVRHWVEVLAGDA